MSNSLWPTDCSLPGSSVHGIFQARILECVAMSSSRGSSAPRSNPPPLAYPAFVVVVQAPSHVLVFVTPWTAARQVSLSLTIFWSLPPSSCPLHRWCHLAIASSAIPFSSCPQSFPAWETFPMSWFFASGDHNTGASASASVLPRSIQGWFPLRLTGCCPRDFQESSPTPQFKGLNSLVLCLLDGPALTTVRDHWENHSLDCTDLCQQSNVSAFKNTA